MDEILEYTTSMKTPIVSYPREMPSDNAINGRDDAIKHIAASCAAPCQKKSTSLARGAFERGGGGGGEVGDGRVFGADLGEFFGHGLHRVADLLGRVQTGEEESQPGRVLLDGRMDDRL